MDIKLEDSNCALIGSSADLEARVKAARTEKEWDGVGKEEGLQIWRVEKFNIKKWPEKKYGDFFDGDCYIILRSYTKGPKLLFNVHFWLGQKSTQDERGTAAYKTVELDDLLGTIPVQYREVQGCESELFMSYFENNTIVIMKGGIASGFHHVGPKKYEPRLFHIKGKRRVQVMQVARECKSLNLGDAFVLDMGLKVYLWLPRKSGATEKYRANMMGNKLKSQRKGCEVFLLDQDGKDSNGKAYPEFWKSLGGQKDVKGAHEVEVDEVFDNLKKSGVQEIWKLSSGTKKKMEFKKVDGGLDDAKVLTPGDVFVIDVGNEILVWIGGKAEKAIRSRAILYAQNYIGVNKKPAWIPVSRIVQGAETSQFWALFKTAPKGVVVEISEEPKKEEPKVHVYELKIHLHSCSDLMKMDKFGKSDPYVIFKTSGTDKVKSKIIKKTLDPKFDEQFHFSFHASDPKKALLKIRAFDYDKLTKDDKLGKVDIPCGMFPKGETITRELVLQGAKTKSGTIKISFTAVNFGAITVDEEKPVTFPSLLLNLVSASIDKGADMKTYNPFVEFCVNHRKEKSGVIKKKNNPKWTEKNNFAFRLNPKHPEKDVLQIAVRSENKLFPKHPLIGKSMVPICLLPVNKAVERVIPLAKKELDVNSSIVVNLKLVDFS